LYEAGPTRRWLKVKKRGWTDAEDRWQPTDQCSRRAMTLLTDLEQLASTTAPTAR